MVMARTYILFYLLSTGTVGLLVYICTVSLRLCALEMVDLACICCILSVRPAGGYLSWWSGGEFGIIVASLLERVAAALHLTCASVPSRQVIGILWTCTGRTGLILPDRRLGFCISLAVGRGSPGR